MLNLWIQDLDGLIAKLQAADIAVEIREEWQEPANGRFARIYDPEGTPIELWEPAPA